MQPWRDGLSLGGHRRRRGMRLVTEDMHFADRTDRPALHDLHYAAIVGLGMNLCAHLRNHAGTTGHFGDGASLSDGVTQRLLDIHMLLAMNGVSRRHRV